MRVPFFLSAIIDASLLERSSSFPLSSCTFLSALRNSWEPGWACPAWYVSRTPSYSSKDQILRHVMGSHQRRYATLALYYFQRLHGWRSGSSYAPRSRYVKCLCKRPLLASTCRCRILLSRILEFSWEWYILYHLKSSSRAECLGTQIPKVGTRSWPYLSLVS